jgi:thiol:disulfide interchange protein DsbA
MKQWLLALLCTYGVANAAITEGIDYVLLNPPQVVQDTAKVEVLEFFGYFCIHCKNFEPLIQKWEASLPKDVAFRQQHIVWDPMTEPGARMAYVVSTLGDKAKQQALSTSLFDIMTKGSDIGKPEVRRNWAISQKLNPDTVEKAYVSYQAVSAAAKAKTLTKNYKIMGTPTLIVDGRYVVKGKSLENNLAITNELIEKVRSARKSPAKQ